MSGSPDRTRKFFPIYAKKLRFKEVDMLYKLDSFQRPESPDAKALEVTRWLPRRRVAGVASLCHDQDFC